MIDLQDLQAKIWANKVAKGFNTTSVEKEFNYTYAELAEVYEAYRKQKPDIGEELADVMIFLLGLAKMLEVDIEREILAKVDKNIARQYRAVNGHNIRVKESEGDMI